MVEEEQIIHKTIVLNWSSWTPWEKLALHGHSDRGRPGIRNTPGLYEVRKVNSVQRLTIGETTNLYRRLRKDIVRGKHSAGERFRDIENTIELEVRWANVEKFKEAEAALKGLYVIKHGALPKYTRQ